jgi:hypothetical protein
MRQPPHLQTVLAKFTFCVVHPVLLWFRVKEMMGSLIGALCFLVPPPLPVPRFPLILPRRLMAAADGFLDMLSIDPLLLLHPQHQQKQVLTLWSMYMHPLAAVP